MNSSAATAATASFQSFEELFGCSPHWIARAPGRVNLIGEHTDYNDGYVLPMAIDRDTTISAAPNSSTVVTFRSTAMNDVVRIDLAQPIERTAEAHWSNYLRGVLAGYRRVGYDIPGFDALIETTIPLGAGLSSSAALEVAMATLLEAIFGERLDPVAKALLCQRAEHEYAGVPCGLMDQYVSTLAWKDHLLLLDCRSNRVQQIPFGDPTISVLIIDSNVKHEHAALGQYAVRRSQCEAATRELNVASLRDVGPNQLEDARESLHPVIFRRARHVVGEIARTTRMADYLRDSDWLRAGQLMYASHESLQYDFDVSCSEVDTIVESAKGVGTKGGVYGCRITGGGFGGCAVGLIDTAAEAAITRALTDGYRAATGITPTIFSSRPAQGAGCVRSVDLETRPSSTRHLDA